VLSKLIVDVDSGERLVSWLEYALDDLFDWLIKKKISALSFKLLLMLIIENQSKFLELWIIIK